MINFTDEELRLIESELDVVLDFNCKKVLKEIKTISLSEDSKKFLIGWFEDALNEEGNVHIDTIKNILSKLR